jgi:CheY-like chemotaxis protein
LRWQGQQTPVILITAYPNEKHRKRVLENGAVGYLSKPFDETTADRMPDGCDQDAITTGVEAKHSMTPC